MRLTNQTAFVVRRLASCGAIILLSGILSGCAKKDAKAAGPPPAVPVMVAKVLQEDVPLVIQAIGNVTPFHTVAIRSQVNGQITAVHFKQGQDVNKGDLLFVLDPRQSEADLKRAQNNLLHDEAQAKNNRVQAERYGKLFKEGVVAKQEYDQFLTAADVSDATVAADKEAAESAKVQLQYTRIYAPIRGRTGDLMMDMGNIVKANDTPFLVTINQVTPIFVNFSIPEQQLPDVKKYSAAGSLLVQARISGQSQPIDGKLTFIDNAVDPATGTIKLKGTFSNTDRKLWPGQFVDVALTLTTQPNSIVVPSQAVQTGQDGQYVYVIQPDMSADLRPVVVQRTVGSESVIGSGLKPGEQVVTDGQLRLTKGAKVELKATQSRAQRAPSQQEPGL